MTETLVPNKYEVIRFQNGQEIIGMVRETRTGLIDKTKCYGIDVWAPMTVHLTSMPSGETIANFMPFTALSEDSYLSFNTKDILFRSPLNQEYIHLYDSAASQWMKLLEDRKIKPISQATGQKKVKEYLDKTARELAEDYIESDIFLEDYKEKKKENFETRKLEKDDKIH